MKSFYHPWPSYLFLWPGFHTAFAWVEKSLHPNSTISITLVLSVLTAYLCYRVEGLCSTQGVSSDQSGRSNLNGSPPGLSWHIPRSVLFIIIIILESRRWTLTTWWEWKVVTSRTRLLSTVVTFHKKDDLILPLSGSVEVLVFLHVALIRDYMVVTIENSAVSDAVREHGFWLASLTRAR